MNDLPEPLTPPDCDLRGMPFMPLDTVRLLDSDFFALATAEEFRIGLVLWCKAWQQVPAASLPDDDRILAHLSGMRDRWCDVRDMSLHGWIKCSDGRLYHPVVAEKAMEALPQRQEFKRKKSADAERKERERQDRKALFAALKAIGIAPDFATKTKDLRDLAAKNKVTISHSDIAVTGHADVTAKRGTGTGILIEEPKGSSRPLAVDHVGQAFADYERLRHAIVPNARAAQLGPDRRKKLAARLDEIGGADGWANILSIVRASPFLSGERTGRLVATIDWLLEPKNLRKVMEGNYDDADRSRLATPTGSSVRNSPIDALSVAIAASGLDR